MQDLLQSQIQDSCRLALPNGLKELMSDISREVLRVQPQNLLKFIKDYLSALLITRENLYIAAQVCNHICSSDCHPALEDELRLFLEENLVSDVADILMKHMESVVNDGNLLNKLISKTSIEERHLPAVMAAVRNAFLRHKRNEPQMYESSSSSIEESETAVKHTLRLYRRVEPYQETFNSISQEIQTSYIHKVKLDTGTTSITETEQFLEKSAPESVISLEESSDKAKANTAHKNQFPPVTKLSSTSLAGSYLSLPKYRPHFAQNIDILEGSPEKERSNYDYTRENSLEEHKNENSKENELKDNSDRDLSEVSEESDSVEETDSAAGDVLAPMKESEIEDLTINIEEINKIPTVFKLTEPAEIDENIVEENSINEKNEELVDIVEENITVEVEDVMEDIPEDING